MENRIKNNYNFKNATSVAFACFKGEKKALQMLVSSIPKKDTWQKIGSSGLHVAYEYALMSDVL